MASVGPSVTCQRYRQKPLLRGWESWFSRVMTDASVHIHQCPFCEVRFLYVNELRDHVINDHPQHADSFISMTPHELS
jgi:hypothetical protein